MEQKHPRLTHRQLNGLVPTILLALLLFAVAAAPSWAGADASAGVANAPVCTENPSGAAEVGHCQGDGGILGAGLIDCKYCDLELCGCPVIEGCVLYFSCICSDIQCTKTCTYRHCIA